MLLDKILEVIPLPSAETKFTQPPEGSYLLWLDSVERRGSDVNNCISDHSTTLELYSSFRDEKSKQAIEVTLDSFALEWERGETIWLQTEKLFMTPYYFEFHEKE